MKIFDGLVTWWLDVVWLSFEARFHGLYHLIRGHDLHWREDASLWIGQFGWIVCHNCPDVNGSSLVIWGRYHSIWMKVAQVVCSVFGGHRDFDHPYTYSGNEDEEGELEKIYIKDKWYCGRCLADVEL